MIFSSTKPEGEDSFKVMKKYIEHRLYPENILIQEQQGELEMEVSFLNLATVNIIFFEYTKCSDLNNCCQRSYDFSLLLLTIMKSYAYLEEYKRENSINSNFAIKLTARIFY